VRFRILGSSSSGNCSLLQTPGARVLIDAGFSGKRIGEMLAAVGERLEDIDAVFLTHEHSDHVCGLPGLSRLPRLKVFATHATCQAIRHLLKRPVDWQLFEAGTSFRFADLEVTAFPIPHDAYDPVGFVFRAGSADNLLDPVRSVAWLTDLGYVPANIRERVRGCDVLVLEANHDIAMLDARRVRGRSSNASRGATATSATPPRWSSSARPNGRPGDTSSSPTFRASATTRNWSAASLATTCPVGTRAPSVSSTRLKAAAKT